jgi:hypothetical protein
MGASYGANRAVIYQTRERDEFRDVDLIGLPGFRIGDVGEPFQLGRNIGEAGELFRRQRTCTVDTNQLVRHRLPVAVGPNAIMYFTNTNTKPRDGFGAKCPQKLGSQRACYRRRVPAPEQGAPLYGTSRQSFARLTMSPARVLQPGRTCALRLSR